MRAASGVLPSARPWPWRNMLQVAVAVLVGQMLMLPAGAAAKDEPTIAIADFEHSPNNLVYFGNSDVVLFQDEAAGSVYRSGDGGAKWSKIEDIGDGKAMAVVMHEFDEDRAYVLTQGSKHWRTEDQGKSWKTFATNADLSIFRSNWLVFHADDKDRILFNGMDCQSIFCEERVTYTIDGFASDAKLLRGNTEGCWWAKSSDLFTTNQDKYDSNRILCIVRDEMSFFKHQNRLVISDNFFAAKSGDGAVSEFEPRLDGAHTVQGVVNLAVVKKYLVVATSSKNTDEMALYVTDDTLSWHRAEFPSDHRINQEAYTVLEGTNYSIQVDVMTTRPSNPMGIMLTSNSNGTYFTRNLEHTNRNAMGHVDFEKISGIQGIFLVNQVDNWKEVQKGPGVEKKMKTKITFDDGRTFESVRAGDKEIHLHSVTELNNVGRVFSSPAPGLVMGNGNRGDHLKAFKDANLYVSDDAGKTWLKALDGPHKYEFGDQGSVLVAVRDVIDQEQDTVSEIKYSLNHGHDWQTIALPDKRKIQPWILTTTQDSSSLKFILTAKTPGKSPKFHVISIDFEGLHEGTCKDSDMEDWYARKDDKGDPRCLMGHTQKFHRRKKDAKCFVRKGPELPESSPCDCSDADFECDFNFVRKDNECVKAGPIAAPPGVCKGSDPDETFKGSSGWRLIPGNDCKRKSGAQKDDQVERKCSDASAPPGPPASGNITHTQTLVKGHYDTFDKHYLERGDAREGKSETIIMRPTKGTANAGNIMITQDHGKKWATPDVLKDASVWMIATHQYFKEFVFFISNKGKVIYSTDGGVTFDSFKAPLPPKISKGGMMPLSFHPDQKDWLIWHGEKCPEGAESGGKGCHMQASISRDRGDNWRTMLRWVDKCEFTGLDAYKKYGRKDGKEMICSARSQEHEKAPFQLIWSDDFFDLKREVRQENVKNFATMAEFIVVASQNDTAKSLQASASLNGRDYADASFPYGMNFERHTEYTVLDSSTHAVNLFLATSEESGKKFGSILKSNSNGTSYVMAVSGVNCDDNYYVDFEKMLGVQGVVLVNVVQNQQSDASERKHLQTKISHDDGARWSFLPPPAEDIDKKEFGCQSDKGDENCALHIHGYTERGDHRKTYSSESAVGIMFGWGNVGSMLGEILKADTFMTTDAGISWQMVKKGRWTWTFGDQGSIIVLAQHEARTNTVVYTLDEGKTWSDYKFSDDEVWIDDITTLRSGSSRNFLLWGHKGKEKKKADELLTVNLDFTGLTDKACHADEDPEESDYVLWSPEHPNEPNGCLFGHQSMYWRKKTDRTCFNKRVRQVLYGLKNCTCNRQDFECDYNFVMDNSGQCSLVEGLQPISLKQYCNEHKNATEYWEPTGYRRIPLTTCQGGRELDKASTPHACPGHEEEFERRHGVSGVAIFFAVVIPICLAAGIGWWVWQTWQSKFGQIRLGEQNGFDQEAPWVKYPVIVISAAVAVVGALPVVASSVWRSASSVFDRVSGRGDGGRYSWLGGGGPRRFTTRDSFSRGRADYAIVDEDEGELLGDESDEEF